MASNKIEYEFLPAALEIQETPPSPMGRLIIWLLISLFVITFAARTTQAAQSIGSQ